MIKTEEKKECFFGYLVISILVIVWLLMIGDWLLITRLERVPPWRGDQASNK